MNSTTTSDVVLDIKDLNIIFNVDFHPNNSFRDQFTQALSHPFKFFFKEANKLHIIKDFNLTIKQGERVGILGVNGAGKTSLCMSIAGMYTPTSGEIISYGDIRAVFNTGVGILPELTGRENATLLARLMYPLGTNIEQLVEESLEFSELGDFVDTPFKYYSKGMQARLFLSIVSSLPCDLLILDEVFDGADAYFSHKITQRLLNLMRESSSVLFVSHSLDQIRQACNKVILINHNEKMFEGDVEEGIALYEQIISEKVGQ